MTEARQNTTRKLRRRRAQAVLDPVPRKTRRRATISPDRAATLAMRHCRDERNHLFGPGLVLSGPTGANRLGQFRGGGPGRLAPAGRRVEMNTGLQYHLLRPFSRLKPLHGWPGGWVLTTASCLRRLGRVGRNRTRPSPATRHFDPAPADWPSLRRGCGLRALGAEFLPASKGNLLDAPGGFR